MMTSSPERSSPNRRGSALVLVLMLTAALAALAASAIFLTSNGAILTKYFDREREFRYAAEAAIARGHSRLVKDTALHFGLPDSGYVTLAMNDSVRGADGQYIKNVRVDIHVGRTGNFTGQFGLFASVVAKAHDGSGARYIRRLELQEENFARWLAYSNSAMLGCYAGGEVMFGPFWANSNIELCGGAYAGARFTDEVGTAGVVINQASGIFAQAPKVSQPRIELPSLARLSRLEAYATAGGYNFDGTNSSAAGYVNVRLEFIALDLNGDGDKSDDNEGFFRVFKGSAPNRLRADWSFPVRDSQCGAWFQVTSAGQDGWGFFTLGNILGTDPARAFAMFVPPDTVAAWRSASVRQILSRYNSRCYPEGDPHLVMSTAGGSQVPGTDFSFVADPTGPAGWLSYVARGGTVPPALATLGRADQDYLFPLYRGDNPNFKGVIYFNGTVALSGVLRGRVTVYTPRTIVLLDELTYERSPLALPALCRDMLGLISGRNTWIANNAINVPRDVDGGGGVSSSIFLDDDRSYTLHGVVMALDDTFAPENFSVGPNASTSDGRCNGQYVGNGCFYQTGGFIVNSITPTFTGYGGVGYMEDRTYDRCMTNRSPPYFPTTGRYKLNRFYEIDPVRFNVSTLFQRLTPIP